MLKPFKDIDFPNDVSTWNTEQVKIRRPFRILVLDRNIIVQSLQSSRKWLVKMYLQTYIHSPSIYNNIWCIILLNIYCT